MKRIAGGFFGCGYQLNREKYVVGESLGGLWGYNRTDAHTRDNRACGKSLWGR